MTWRLPGAPGKYGAKRSESSDGLMFASKRERDRYEELLLLQRAGAISELKRQVRYPLVVNGVKVATYVSDFEYEEKPEKTSVTFTGNKPIEWLTWQHIVEDVKGVRTPAYRMKAKLMLACYRITIRET